MKKADQKLKPLTPGQLTLATGGVVPVVLGGSTFDSTAPSPGTVPTEKSAG